MGNFNTQKYPTYKDSGVDWLGEIPINWDVLPGLSFIIENKDRNKGMVRKTILSLSYGNVRVKGDDELTGLVPESFETYQFVNKGDLIFRPTDLQNDTVSLRSSISEFEGIITNAYLNLRFKSKANSKFFHYFFRAIDNNKVIYGLGSGLRQNISFLDFRRFLFPFPPLAEQTAIAEFLDRKTALIDQAIGIKQKQIELLKERRQILIHKAVTRGLNPNVKTKDSVVEWIGEIPEGWEVNKLRGVCNFIRGNSTFSKDELLNNGRYIALQYGKTYKVDEINENYNFYVNDEFYKKTQVVCFDDTILISTSETIEDLGHSAYYNRNDIGLIGGEQILLRPKKKINGHYLYFYSKIFSRNLRKFATGIKVYRFNVNNLKSIYLSIPSLSEQKQIVEFIKKANTKTSTAISFKEQEIEKLKEYKASLINSAVTGKIKVYDDAE
jgi:type I restriction enzyme S subunit